jgi:RNA ligase (TIGR02306 family)
MRKLSSIRTIDSIKAIRDANAIECATIGGWEVVVKKGEFNEGDRVIYFEIDSFIPVTVAPFLTKGSPQNIEGIEGNRLKTVKLRGQISQGLILPTSILSDSQIERVSNGEPVDSVLGVKKWEPTDTECENGNIHKKGDFPFFIPKTDQERIQNLALELEDWKSMPIAWEVTEKLDGSSITAFFRDGTIGVCSRNQELIESDRNQFWKAAKSSRLTNTLQSLGLSIAVQCELVGPGIQGNRYKLEEPSIYVFDIFDINRQEYYAPKERRLFCESAGLEHVPVFISKYLLSPLCSCSDLLSFSEGVSNLNPETQREGFVFKCLDGKKSFKVISNSFLLNSKN